MRLPVRLVACGLCALFAAATVVPPVATLSAQGDWWEFYREGLEALDNEEWDRAESEFVEARKRRQEQGRKIPVPGRVIDYLPDYYLGLVYVQLNRFQEASDLLQSVLQTRLVEEDDPEFPELQRALDESRRGNLTSFKARTVKIDAVRADGSVETGTGIIVGGVSADPVYVVTALHVLVADPSVAEAPASIEVSFFAGENQPLAGPVPGNMLEPFDADLDLAAIRIESLPQGIPRPAPWEYRQTPLQRDERIFTVGHAVEDYGTSDTNVVQNPTDSDSRRFVISTAGIGERASGGPVVDSRGYLAGVMVLLLPGSGGASAVRVDEVVRMMRLWGIDAADRPERR